MTGAANSTIAALCYAQPTELDFHELAAELGQALWESSEIEVTIDAEYDDFVIFDLPTARICLAYSDLRAEFPDSVASKSYAECLIMSVGSGPDVPGEGPFYENREELCKGMVHRVEDRHTSDRFILMERDEVFTYDIYDALLEQIHAMIGEAEDAATSTLSQMDAPEPEGLAATASRKAANEAPINGHAEKKVWAFASISPSDVLPDLEARYEAEAAIRADYLESLSDDPEDDKEEIEPWQPKSQRIVPTHPAAAADSKGSAALHANIARPNSATDRLRTALYPPDEALDEDERNGPVIHRAAIHALNTSMMAFSLPVGAALLTLAILGRESMAMSARATALTGSAMGVSQTDIPAQLLSFFV